MKHANPPENQATRRTSLITYATALVVALSAALPQAARADHRKPPSVPANIQVPAGNKLFLKGHAVGTQNYVCLPSSTPSGFAWILFGPQATLFNENEKQIMTHYLSSNPMETSPNAAETGLPRATWQHSRDTSAVWAVAIANSTDPAYVAPGAIPWLLLRIVGSQYGPGWGDKLTPATFIHRVSTVAGIAPSTGCALSTDVGKKVLVPYEADYFFYKDASNEKDDN